MSSFETSKNNAGFKKRALRPWKSTALDKSIPQTMESDAPLEMSNEFLQKQLEASLEIKSQQHSELQTRFTQFEDKRITVGGFFQPKNILFVNEEQNSTLAVLQELKEKEIEILEINHQLKLTQALEQIQQTENQLRAEELARQSAEEKAMSALRQAHQATEQIQMNKEKAYLSEQAILKLQQTVVDLEKQLKETMEQYQDQLTTLSKDLERSQELSRLETELRQFIEIDFQKTKAALQLAEQDAQEKNRTAAQLVIVEADLHEKNQRLVHLQTTLEHLQNELSLANETGTQQSRAIKKLNQMVYELEESFSVLQSNYDQLLLQHQKLQVEFSESQQTLEETTQAYQVQLKNINAVVETERDLRIFNAEKLRTALAQLNSLEEKLQIETAARKAAEQLAAQKVEEANIAVMQILNASALIVN